MQALSQTDKEGIFEVCSQLLQARDQDDLLACVKGPLQALLSQESFACGLGRLGPEGLAPRVIVAHRFPERYLETIAQRGRIRPQTLRYWAVSREPLAINFSEEDQERLPADMTQSARRFGFYNMICHGQVDLDRNHISYVTLNRIPELVRPRHRFIAAHIMPHLHSCLLRLSGGDAAAAGGIEATCGGPEPVTAEALTERQQEILHLIALGKTNWEIGQILDTSVNNVKYHVKRLGVMFGATSRTAIVAQAMHDGLVPVDQYLN